MTVHNSKTSARKTFKLKPLSKDGIDAALEKAETYRLLNQPRLAESICQDILAIDGNNQKALVFLLLALTDQFGKSSSKAVKQAQEIASGLKDNYAREYYTGIILERQGTVALNSGIPGAEFDACEWYLDAMRHYEKAESLTTESNNDPILRWNTCARTIMQYNLQERPLEEFIMQSE